jgi:hypothetical protein
VIQGRARSRGGRSRATGSRRKPPGQIEAGAIEAAVAGAAAGLADR